MPIETAVEEDFSAWAQFAPGTFADACAWFACRENCICMIASRRWRGGKVLCPVCGAEGARYLATRAVWECRNDHPKQQFSVRAGTLLEDSHVTLEQWLTAIWMLANAETRISSHELARRLGITQKSAWFLLRRMRSAFQLGRTRQLARTGLRAVCKGF